MTRITAAQHNEIEQLALVSQSKRTAGKRVNFSQEFKERVVTLHRQGVSPALICRELNLASSVFYSWFNKARVHPAKRPRIISVQPQVAPPSMSEDSTAAQTLSLILGQFSISIKVA
jgi:transposase-like protein